MGADQAFINQVFTDMLAIPLPPHLAGEWLRVGTTSVWVKFWGNELHVRDWGKLANVFQLWEKSFAMKRHCIPSYQFVLKQSYNRRLYADEWHPEQREVRLEYGFRGKTNWHEVYRSGRHIRSTRFIQYLKLLGEQKCSPPTSNAESSSPLTRSKA